MFNKIGLGGILTFTSRQAERAMGRVDRAFAGLTAAARRTSIGTGLTVSSLSTMAVAMVPLIAAGKEAIDIYSSFTKQMSAVKAVGQLNEQQFQTLREEAIKLGGSTAFTATEAAQGMEELTRAGFSVEEVMAATGATLNLAASDSMSLADASRVTANIIRGLSLEASEAARVADVLATTSAKSNTNVMDLGESFKMAIPTMSLLGIELEEGAALMGKLADAGLRGTMGGTSFANMMNKIVRPTDKAAAFMKKYHISLTNADGSMRKVTNVVQDVAGGLMQIDDVGKRTAMAMELTGLRGVKAVNALMNALAPPNNINKLEDDLNAAGGAAQRMADERLNNLAGQMTLLKSAIEGFIIRFLDMFKSLSGSGIKPIVDTIVALNSAWDDLNKLMSAGISDMLTQSVLAQKYGDTIAGIVLGVRDGIKTIQGIFAAITEQVRQWAGSINEELGVDAVRSLTKVATVIAGMSVIIAPIAAAVAGIGYIIGTVIVPAFVSLWALIVSGLSTIQAMFIPLIKVLGIVGATFMVIRNENETVLETVTRVWNGIKTIILWVWNTVLKPFWAGIKSAALEVWPPIQAAAMEAFAVIRQIVNEFATAFFAIWNTISTLWNAGTNNMRVDWLEVGRVVVKIAGVIVKFFVKFVVGVLKIVLNIISNIRQAFVEMFSGSVLTGLKRLGQTLINVLIFPLRKVAVMLAQLMESMLEIPGAAKVLGEERVAAIQSMATKARGFGAQGIEIFDLPEPEQTRDYVAEFGQQTQEAASPIADIEALNADLEADQMARVMEAGIKAGVSSGMKNVTIENKTDVKLDLDGKTVAKNQGRHQQDLADRLGAQTTPFVRRVRAEQGTV